MGDFSYFSLQVVCISAMLICATFEHCSVKHCIRFVKIITTIGFLAAPKSARSQLGRGCPFPQVAIGVLLTVCGVVLCMGQKPAERK